MEKKFKDCYVNYDGKTLIIGNSKIEREIIFINNIPVSLSVGKDSVKWAGGNSAMFNVGTIDYKKAAFSVNFHISNFGGESEQALCCELIYLSGDMEIKQILFVFPDIPAISSKLFLKGKAAAESREKNMINTAVEADNHNELSEVISPECGVIDSFNIGENHIKLKSIKLLDETDINNELVICNESLLYRRYNEFFDGNIFVLNNYIHSKSLMIVSEGYVSGKKLHSDKDFMVNRNSANVYGDCPVEYVENYTFLGGATVVLEQNDNLSGAYKAFYTKMYKNEQPYIMSNTWGDRNRDTAVCEKFILKEIDRACELDIDVVQIDDGWQKGLTANSGFVKQGAWGNFYDTDTDFWEVNSDRFPNGFHIVKEYAQKKGIKLGLWFSMDKNDSYARWETDAKKVLDLYKKYGITYFKIDGLQISNYTCEHNIFKFINMIERESNNKIKFNFDITANRRFGYFVFKQYSSLFVENRYTDWKNYYPHSTLRNLWSLAEYIPAHKLQFELLNEKRNDDKYGNDDLRPSQYPIDYLFASVMVANPLLWMEMSKLDNEQAKLLKHIIDSYKKERKNFVNSCVTPIGERPDGMSYTGFDVACGGLGYLILLKEKANDDFYDYSIKNNIKNFEILATNCSDAIVKCKANKIFVSNMSQRSYLFIKYNA